MNSKRLTWMSVWVALVALLFIAGCGGGYSARKEAPASYPGGGDSVADAESDEGMAYPQTTGIGGALRSTAGLLANNAPAPPPPPPAPAPAPSRPGPSEAKPDVPAPVAQPEPAVKPVVKKVKPLLIYTATLHMAVFESTKSIEAVLQLAKDMGGYLVRRSDQQITVRVPSAQFYPALEGVEKLGDVLHRNESVRDVTDKFFDLRARLKNAKVTRDRLQVLLGQAKNVKEVLLVEKELARITEQIERMEGKLKLMRELIAFSTITVKFKPRPTEKVKSKVRLPFPWLNRLGLNPLLKL